jgi:hypothetical protein
MLSRLEAIRRKRVSDNGLRPTTVVLGLAVYLTASWIGASAADELLNHGFEQDLQGWTVIQDRGFGADVLSGSDAVEGSKYLRTGWRARNAAPRTAQIRITVSVDAEPYRGHRVRFSAMTRAPDFAAGSSDLIARSAGASGEMSAKAAPIATSKDWSSHSLDFMVTEDVETIELGFVVRGTGGELDADATQLEIVE